MGEWDFVGDRLSPAARRRLKLRTRILARFFRAYVDVVVAACDSFLSWLLGYGFNLTCSKIGLGHPYNEFVKSCRMTEVFIGKMALGSRLTLAIARPQICIL
ncbi:hypothetical protein SDJN03_05948, partial [Cucurbita argyrosperma subsp. sororia]